MLDDALAARIASTKRRLKAGDPPHVYKRFDENSLR